MALNLVLVPQRQSSKGMALAWGEMEGVQAYEVFVAHKRLSPEELEAAESLGGTDDCLFAKVGPEVKSVVDDVTPAGAPPRRAPPPPAAAPLPPVPAEDPLEARKRAQREARARVTAESLTEPPGPAEVFGRGQPFIRVAPGAESPRAAAQPPPPAAAQPARPAQEPARPPQEPPRAASQAAPEPPAPPSSIPLEHDLEVRMSGADQTWDGLRICWDRDPRAAAYEVIVSDHQIFAEELKDALAGRADFTTAVAVAPSVSAVIDNVTPRDARGWYAVLVRSATASARR